MNPEDALLVRSTFTILYPFVMIAWAVHLLNEMTGHKFSYAFAMYPRRSRGLIGVATSPFLHADWRHLWHNTSGFVVLGGLTLIQGYNLFLFVTIAIALVCGLMTWLTENNPCIGASGVIFGYMGFLLIFGLTSGSHLATLAGVAAGVIYGQLIGGIAPSSPNVSWKAHFWGFISGLAIGYFLAILRQT